MNRLKERGGTKMFIVAIKASNGKMDHLRKKLYEIIDKNKYDLIYVGTGRPVKTIYAFNHSCVQKRLIIPNDLSQMSLISEINTVVDFAKGKLKY